MLIFYFDGFLWKLYKNLVLPLATHCAGIPPVAAVNTENVSLHVGVPGEQFETNSASELVLGEGRGFKLGIFMMFLEFVGLEQLNDIYFLMIFKFHLTFHNQLRVYKKCLHKLPVT